MYEVAEGATIISIHAPARGATYYDKKSKSKHRNFNPRSRKGSDLPPNSINFCWRYFNPRSRKGSDTANIGKRNKNKISIHAPARGATAIITNFHTQLLFKITIFSYIASPLSFPISLFPIHSSIFCAIFQVRIPHRFYVSFRFAPDYKISVWSAAVPRSTPICSTFVWYLFPR